jgi:hypothetical protein
VRPRHVVLILCLPLLGCTGHRISGSVLGTNDSDLFRMVVSQLRADGTPLRVDPRVLRGDPSIVSLRNMASLAAALPESAQRVSAGFIEDTAFVRARRASLVSLDVPETNALADTACPGVMVEPGSRVDSLKTTHCPSSRFRNAVMAAPRQGGAFWPGRVDERQKFGARAVYSVRVISRSLGPQGSVESASDFVFENRAGVWSLLEVKDLLLIE